MNCIESWGAICTLFAPCIADATARMTAMATAATAALTDTQDALAAPSLTTD